MLSLKTLSLFREPRKKGSITYPFFFDHGVVCY
jgi:hypothetical protein